MSRISPVDTVWESLLAAHPAPEGGPARIPAAALTAALGTSLRAELDRSGQTPLALRRAGLSLLPLSPEEYAVGPLDTHRAISYSDARPSSIAAPGLESLRYVRLSEPEDVLRFCLCAGVFDHLTGGRAQLTAGGPISCGRFDFRIGSAADPTAPFPLSAADVPAEVWGVEGPEAFCLCAVRTTAVDALPIHQLYYPYRLWRDRLRKPVIPVLLVHTNDLFHLFRYAFADDGDSSSLTLVEHQAYAPADRSITVADVRDLWRRTAPGPEPELPFPQADTFPRVVDLLSILAPGPVSRDAAPFRCGLDPRQTDFYINACQYLGLAESRQEADGVSLRLSDEGQRVMALPWQQRELALMEHILRRPVFHKAFGRALQLGDAPNKELVIRMMLECGLPLNETTMDRRASTVRGWVSWMLSRCGEGAQLSLL